MDRHHAMKLIFERMGSNVIPNHKLLGRLEFDEDNVHVPEDPGAWNIFPSVLMMTALAVFAGLLLWLSILLFKRKEKPTTNVRGSFSTSYIESFKDDDDDGDSCEDSPLLESRKKVRSVSEEPKKNIYIMDSE